MNNNLKVTLSFVAGAAAGVAASWFILKKRYEQITNDEIATFKEEYRGRMEEKKAATENLEKITDKFKEETERLKDIDSVEKIISEEGYSNNEEKGETDGSSETRKKPYVIKPDELGDEQYEICVLTYYADKVLTNDWDEVIEDVEGTVGKENLKTFGQYEEDAIYVRNDELELDYEINKDARRFVDIGLDDEYDD
jgi:hypothetical protein